jgi:2',3'-cyclic-nucleotide 2'-phosphodiesterase (5'-nucleotidase family)
VRQIRAANPNILLVDSGGTLVPATSDGGAGIDEQLVQAMGEMGYAALNAGPGELRASPEALRRLAEQGTPALVSANGHLASSSAAPTTPGGLVRPYVVREVGGVRVGIVGVTSQDSSGEQAGVVAPARDALSGVLPEIRRQADVIVALADLPPGDVEALAAAGLDVQVILGSRGGVSREATRVGQTIVAAAAGDGRSVGRLVLQIDPRGQVVSYEGGQRYLDASVGEASVSAH